MCHMPQNIWVVHVEQGAGRETISPSPCINPLITLTESEFLIHEHQKSWSRNTDVGELCSPSGDRGAPRTLVWDRRPVGCSLEALLTEESWGWKCYPESKRVMPNASHAKCMWKGDFETYVILSDENPRKMDNFVFSIPRSAQQCWRAMAMEKVSLRSALHPCCQLHVALKHIWDPLCNYGFVLSLIRTWRMEMRKKQETKLTLVPLFQNETFMLSCSF